VVVGGLEKTGAIQALADLIANFFRDQHLALLSTLLWFSAVSSAIVDNVPFALSMAYVIRDMAGQTGVPALSIMVWAVSLGTDIGGNGTPIGASANVVAYTSMEKKGVRIGWGRWMRLAIPPTLVALLISNLGIAVKLALKFF
jgi:Na+/H+ antiporter NhaD/arsenite permease-like protein